MEDFLGTKSRRNISERLKQKVDLFIETKYIFNPFYYYMRKGKKK